MSDVWPSADEGKKRILILADSHGRHISGILSYVLRRKSEVLVIFKPNATLSCVAEDIDRLTTSFTMADVVVLIGGTNDLDRGSSAALVSTVEGLQRRFQQRTQMIVATLPRRYDDRRYNRLIDELNAGIRALRSRYGRMKILELSDMGKDYHTNQGLHLNVKGKIKLCLKLCREMDSLPRMSVLSPPMRKVAEFLKLFTLPDSHRFNCESPRKDDNSTDMKTTENPQAPQEKLLRVRNVVIEASITVPRGICEEHGTSESTIPKPFNVFLGRSENGDDLSTLKSLRIKKANSYWAENTFSLCLNCHATRSPFNLRIGSTKAVKLHVLGSELQTIFIVTESGLRFTVNQEPTNIILTVDARKFFNVDKIDNVNYEFDESTVVAEFSKWRYELQLKIKSRMRLRSSAVVRCIAMTGDSGKDTTRSTLKREPDGSFLVNETGAEDTGEDCRRIPPHIIIHYVRFEESPFTLRPDVAVFSPILIVSSQIFVIFFHSSDHVKISHYAEFFVISNAVLVRHVRLPLCNYVIRSSRPNQGSVLETDISCSDLHDGFRESRIVPYNCKKARTEELFFANETLFLEKHCCSLNIHHISPLRDSEENGRSEEGDTFLTDPVIMLIKHCLCYFKTKNLSPTPGNKAKKIDDVTCLKQTRKARSGGETEITKQLTKVTTTYLSCCGDFNSAMIMRHLKSGTQKSELKAKDSKNC